MAAPLQNVFRTLCRSHAVRSAVQRSTGAGVISGHQMTQVRFKGKGRYKMATDLVSSREQRIKRTKRVQELQEIIDKESDAELMARVPADDVWIRAYYPDPRLSFPDAVNQLRQFACPEMLDNMDGTIQLHLTLNVSTKKKTKFMGNFIKTMLLPHKFGKEIEKRVVAFCKTPEDIQKAKEAKAAYVGGLDLMRAFEVWAGISSCRWICSCENRFQIEKGEIHHEDYDIVVSTMDMIDDITPLKKLLKDLFPNSKKGSVGFDIEELVTKYVEGKTFESTRDENNVGHVTMDVGLLSMSDEQLIANFQAYISEMNRHRTPPSGPFITKAFLTCAPSADRVILAASETIVKEKSEEVETQQEAVAA
ncbi:hypothetical protein CAPTEDRAFT_190708 [Capitella teleta]|uniref:Ribosomal protein L1 n=1 Tax=Capitella teleta TaxID=283909 RepID=R7TS36_CAPTE|nr:hypothetical protein CAPTEDRAFT_190708 [Capitella teleta]|eukprot:ELT96464.1 hypothetical protein CAPTEDRAFT_190708 [Capitella teleta]